MNKLVTQGAVALLGVVLCGSALAATHRVTAVFHEPDTQPRNTIFVGTFDYAVSQTNGTTAYHVTNLEGMLSESMTGNPDADASMYPDYQMNWLRLDHQLVTWHDAALGGTFAAAFRNPNTSTFTTMFGGDGWSPASGIAAQGIYHGFPFAANNPGNAYVLLFVPHDPLAALTQPQIDKLAYADCAPGGMMAAACMTATSVAGYGSLGTMSGFPLSQTITAVPEPGAYALMIAGLTLLGLGVRRRVAR